MLLTPAQIKPKWFESRWNSSFFFTRGGCVSCLRACLGARLLPQSCWYPNLSEGADRVGGQLRGDKVCPFSGVTSFGRVGRTVPESDAGCLEDGAGKRRWEFGGGCRKAMLGVLTYHCVGPAGQSPSRRCLPVPVHHDASGDCKLQPPSPRARSLWAVV